MELETTKLVAFALWAESNEGVTGKSPGDIKAAFETVRLLAASDLLMEFLTPDLAWKLDNYLTVWEAAEEPEAPTRVAEKLDRALAGIDETESDKAFDELESASPEEQKETPAEETPPESEKKELSVQEKFARGVKHPMGPKKQRGKRGQGKAR